MFEECRVDRSFVTSANLLLWSARAAESSREQQTAANSTNDYEGQPSHAVLKLSSVMRLLLICRRRNKRVGLFLS